MTDETPQSEGEPSPATPEESPTAETKPFTYDDAVAQTPATRTTSPRRGGSADPGRTRRPRPSPRRPSPVAAAPATTDRPAGIFIPKWVGLVAAAIVAALIFGGIGYAIGDSSSDSGSTQSASNAFPNGNANGPTAPAADVPRRRAAPTATAATPERGQLPERERQLERQR